VVVPFGAEFGAFPASVVYTGEAVFFPDFPFALYADIDPAHIARNEILPANPAVTGEAIAEMFESGGEDLFADRTLHPPDGFV